jgi:hypothetical protein
MAFLITAYVVIIGAILGYTVRLFVAERACRRRLEALLESRSPR